jgi:hypothetical protein
MKMMKAKAIFLLAFLLSILVMKNVSCTENQGILKSKTIKTPIKNLDIADIEYAREEVINSKGLNHR